MNITRRTRRNRTVAVGVTIALAAIALAVPSVVEAATSAKPAPAQADEKGPAAPGPGNAKASVREGIVQSVSTKAIVLRELDGTTVRVAVAPSTRVFVDGKKAKLSDVKAGFVAFVAWKPGKPARVLQVFDLSGRNAVTVGVVDSVSTRALVVTVTGGDTVSIPINAKTRVLIDGKPATLAAVKSGYTVVITARDLKGSKPAHELRFLRPV